MLLCLSPEAPIKSPAASSPEHGADVEWIVTWRPLDAGCDFVVAVLGQGLGVCTSTSIMPQWLDPNEAIFLSALPHNSEVDGPETLAAYGAGMSRCPKVRIPPMRGGQ